MAAAVLPSHYWQRVATLLLLGLLFSADLHATDDRAPAAPYDGPVVWQLSIQGVIGPASSDLLIRTLDRAEQDDIHMLLVTLDTPGGLMSSMRTMISRILAANIPVLIWVTPKGARAASAGTYLIYASHLAAMSPATNLGAATPVQIGLPSSPDQPQEGEDATGQPALSPMEKKVINDAVAYIRGLAALQGRNADWAELAVREGASLDAEEALALQVIEILAYDREDLLNQAEGRRVSVNDEPYLLSPLGLPIIEVELDWRYRFLSTLTDPNVAYILMMIGVYGLILEFYNPGVGIAGILGAISLLTALYALQLLPVNYAGMALLLLGLALMMAEVFSPSFGVLGIGGLIAFILGSILLMDTDLPEFQIAWPVIAAFSLTSGLVCFILLGLALRSRNTPLASGVQQLVGQQALTLEPIQPQGRVRLNGEIWFAHSSQPIAAQQPVIVTAVAGLTLEITPIPLSDRRTPDD